MTKCQYKGFCSRLSNNHHSPCISTLDSDNIPSKP